MPGFWHEAWLARWALANGLLVTAELSLIVIAAGTLIGFVLGVGLALGPWPVRALARLYVDLVRGIPILVLVLFMFYGLALFRINVAAFWGGAIALTVFCVAHVAENVRGAIGSIPAAQGEAAKAIGLRGGQRLRYVILPQALRRMVPPWINTAVEIVKGTPLVSIIGVVELLLATQQAIARNRMVIPFYLLACALYIGLCFLIAQAGALLERRFAHLRY